MSRWPRELLYDDEKGFHSNYDDVVVVRHFWRLFRWKIGIYVERGTAGRTSDAANSHANVRWWEDDDRRAHTSSSTTIMTWREAEENILWPRIFSQFGWTFCISSSYLPKFHLWPFFFSPPPSPLPFNSTTPSPFSLPPKWSMFFNEIRERTMCL